MTHCAVEFTTRIATFGYFFYAFFGESCGLLPG